MSKLQAPGAFRVHGRRSYTRPSDTPKNSAETRLLALFYDDWRDVLKVDNRSLAARRADRANIRIATFGGHILDQLQTTGLDALLWSVVQTGRWGIQDHRAYAIDVEGGVQGFIRLSHLDV
jgi:hypothetical protein